MQGISKANPPDPKEPSGRLGRYLGKCRRARTIGAEGARGRFQVWLKNAGRVDCRDDRECLDRAVGWYWGWAATARLLLLSRLFLASYGGLVSVVGRREGGVFL
ncbi:hypothetical protein P170DRAFT_24986 [Aspergillus steynii IBT 23096]|uniref:Uncharacterized protein n=1 Tax=Aspergillus steynii IBT 23096 TaxID=1392250 RepID=A0A2I2GPJ4_9EURO|nr:uncharacterized protein P170DRAFT_24986 [Aspergillus steynii IBT 23096]PLB54797.1 hypothetical protein P170DRAFT_24986 [Aspergillus steynii IBT 23096]